VRNILEPIQAAIYSVIHAAYPLRKVFTSIPDMEQVPPFIRIGDGSALEDDVFAAKDIPIFGVTYQIEAWDRSVSKENVHTLIGEVLSALTNTPLNLSAHDLSVLDGPSMESLSVGEQVGDAGGVYQRGLASVAWKIQDRRI
jgi:hypothetical protein